MHVPLRKPPTLNCVCTLLTNSETPTSRRVLPLIRSEGSLCLPDREQAADLLIFGLPPPTFRSLGLKR